ASFPAGKRQNARQDGKRTPTCLCSSPQEGQRHIHLLTHAFRIILPHGIKTSKAVSTSPAPRLGSHYRSVDWIFISFCGPKAMGTSCGRGSVTRFFRDES